MLRETLQITNLPKGVNGAEVSGEVLLSVVVSRVWRNVACLLDSEISQLLFDLEKNRLYENSN